MTASPSASVEPSGRPRTARTWFSNWLVTAPSIVQWPVLWTRGANSFARSVPVDLEQLDREHADVAELRRGASSRSPPPRAAAHHARARATRRGSRRGARSRRAGRSACRRRGRAPPRSRARDRTGRSPPPARRSPSGSSDSDDPLALAVVAEPARLHERGHAGLLQRAEARGRDAEAAGRAPSRRGGPGPARAHARRGPPRRVAPPRPGRSRTRR